MVYCMLAKQKLLHRSEKDQTVWTTVKKNRIKSNHVVHNYDTMVYVTLIQTVIKYSKYCYWLINQNPLCNDNYVFCLLL